MGCSVNHIQINESQSNSDISQDLQEVEISILSIHEGIQCLKINIEHQKQNYPDDIIKNEIQEQIKLNQSSQESGVQSDSPSKKSCLKQLSGSSLSLSKYATQKKVQFSVIQSKFSQQKKQKKRKRRPINRPEKQINLDDIF
ncbi:unnamed protein product [Paramecium pentaurelia]|uniref:Uncharacterized protein n=1 Tax=Paramecium pentaurelia TaxID=43138 RepID=A0A8S1XLW9_9CILI|nr:unnamed protein product [Paramecium pentaurelia]